MLIAFAFICYYQYNAANAAVFAVSVLFNLVMGKFIFAAGSEKTRKILLSAGVAFDLIQLGVFKYTSLVMPLGISFFTFREISYLVYMHKNRPAAYSFCSGLLYISFFPQFVSGPIVQYKDFTVSDKTGIYSRSDMAQFISSGTIRFMKGFAKKVLLADTLAKLVSSAYTALDIRLSTPIVYIASVAYSLQLYYDFSGYSDMAIGLSDIFGFTCPENFDHPYASSSVSEFWRRWHITLGAFFRDNVYIPMGGSRTGTARLIFNLFVVWLLTGIWHGASYTFVIWGMIHFAFIAFEKLTGIPNSSSKPVKYLWRVVTLFAVNAAWIVFRTESISRAAMYIKTMFVPTFCGAGTVFINSYGCYALPFAAAALFCLPVGGMISARLKERPALYETLRCAAILLLFFVSLSLTGSNANDPFLYSNF